MKILKLILKIFNPIIWLWNFFMYGSHLDMYRHAKKYKSYDFSKEIKYF